MFERFTDRARKVMVLANQEAQHLKHEYIGTEHILLGLIKEGSGVGANVLKNLKVDLRRARGEVEMLIHKRAELASAGELPQTPRAKKVIEYAIYEARQLSHNYVGTEHLLLGLLRENDGVAAQVLLNLGVSLDEVRVEVRNLLGAGIDDASGSDRAAAGRRAEAMRAHSGAAPELAASPEVLIWLLAQFIEQLHSAKDVHVIAADYEKAAALRDISERARLLLEDVRAHFGK
ncbi:MAG: hypothetical protein CHACPFDD_03636 [Phycisphaerae bacterium]|nr:hypothetical protein [Phycisphaerae bacterium]